MRAAVLSHPAKTSECPLRIGQFADPEVRAGEVQIRVRACGVCRTDLHIVEGELEPSCNRCFPGTRSSVRLREMRPGSLRQAREWASLGSEGRTEIVRTAVAARRTCATRVSSRGTRFMAATRSSPSHAGISCSSCPNRSTTGAGLRYSARGSSGFAACGLPLSSNHNVDGNPSYPKLIDEIEESWGAVPLPIRPVPEQHRAARPPRWPLRDQRPRWAAQANGCGWRPTIRRPSQSPFWSWRQRIIPRRPADGDRGNGQ